MNKEQFLNYIRKTYEKGVGIIERKNSDYANSSNPFRNFESANIVGLDVDRAILVRVLDKLSRISNLLDKEKKGEDRAVLDESLEDTCLDCINYLAILMAFKHSQYDDTSESESTLLSGKLHRSIQEKSV